MKKPKLILNPKIPFSLDHKREAPKWKCSVCGCCFWELLAAQRHLVDHEEKYYREKRKNRIPKTSAIKETLPHPETAKERKMLREFIRDGKRFREERKFFQP